ncbi:MAG: DNA polymerase III subunit delta [Micropepsaceae bacterium]
MRVSSSSEADKLSAAPPKAWVAALVFGSNSGLVRERADRLAKSVVPDMSDAFRVADLGADVLRKDPARLGDEAGAISMFGGRRVVRVRDATDGLADLFEGFLSDPVGDSFVVIEAGELTKTSSLRKLFEAAKAAGAIECYDDKPEDAARLIRETLTGAGWEVEADALAYLADALSADRRLLRSELDKLVTYLGPAQKGVKLSRNEAVTLIGDSGAVEIDEIADAVVAGDLKLLDRLIVKAAESNVSWTGAVGAALRMFQRLGSFAEGGGGPSWGRSSYYEQRMQAQLSGWDHARLVKAMRLLAEAEAQTRLTGFPEAAIAQQALTEVAILKGRG